MSMPFSAMLALSDFSDEKLHAPNEFLRVARLREGMRAWEQLWRLLAKGGLSA